MNNASSVQSQSEQQQQPHRPPLPPPGSKPDLEWAKQFVASLDPKELVAIQKMRDEHEQQQKRMADEAAVAAEQKKREQEQLQQQAILVLLSAQKPVTIDVRSSISPDSQTSQGSSTSDNQESSTSQQTVKDVILGKMKSNKGTSVAGTFYKPYTPRPQKDPFLFEGFIFNFDKESYDSKKRFLRCERRKTCPARVHTPIDGNRVIHRVQKHNHQAPTPEELSVYEIDFGKVKHGHILPIMFRNALIIPNSFLTGTSDEENNVPLVTPQVFGQLSAQFVDSTKTPVSKQIPENFNKPSGQEIHEIEMAITEYLMEDTSLRKEFMDTEKSLPMIFPHANKEDLVLFIAKKGNDEDIFKMIRVPERNELSIRNAIQEMFGETCSRALLMNVSGKINIPLNQQMIDSWKTEEFVRIDIAKPSHWIVYPITSIE